MRQQDDEHGMVIRYLWGWLGGGQVSYHYGGRGAKEILTVLQRHPPPDPSLPRYALTDGYGAYDSPLTAAGFIHAGCWTHIRREFKPLAPSFQHAKEVFDLINKLYRIEKQIKKSAQNVQMSPEDACRHAEAVRHEKAKPILDHIATAYETYAHLYQPETAMRKAFNQLGNQFEKLRVYASTGHVPIDNNEVERGMRLVAVGRKNYLFVGSEDAGDWCATMYTIVESCRMGKPRPAPLPPAGSGWTPRRTKPERPHTTGDAQENQKSKTGLVVWSPTADRPGIVEGVKITERLHR